MAEIAAITPDEARKIVTESGMMLLPGCTLTSAIAHDAIRRDPQASVSEEHFHNRVFGSGYSPKLNTLAIWSMAPNTRKHEVVSLVEVIGSMVVKRPVDITPVQAAKLTVHYCNA